MIELQNFCESPATNQNKIAEFCLTSEEWISVKHIESILSHFAKQTTRMQKETISLSDFFGAWARIKMELSKYRNDTLASNLLLEMNKRETVLFNNDVLNAAVFLDPRFQQFMPADKKDAAIIFLSKLHKRIESIQHSPNGATNAENSCEPDEFEEFLNGIYGSNDADNNSAETHADNDASNERASNDINTILKKFGSSKHEPMKSSIFDYWNNNMNVRPEVRRLAFVVHSVPPTQTTVERSFSAMALILTHLRTTLSDRNLENILLVRLNAEIFNDLCDF